MARQEDAAGDGGREAVHAVGDEVRRAHQGRLQGRRAAGHQGRVGPRQDRAPTAFHQGTVRVGAVGFFRQVRHLGDDGPHGSAADGGQARQHQARRRLIDRQEGSDFAGAAAGGQQQDRVLGDQAQFRINARGVPGPLHQVHQGMAHEGGTAGQAVGEAVEEGRLEGEKAQQPVHGGGDGLGTAGLPGPHLGRHHVDEARSLGAQGRQAAQEAQVEARVVHRQHHLGPAGADDLRQVDAQADEFRQALQHGPQAHDRQAVDAVLDLGPGLAQVGAAHGAAHQVRALGLEGRQDGPRIGIPRGFPHHTEEIARRGQGHGRGG